MQYKKFLAETYDRAVSKMRMEMGFEAMILGRKDIKKGGFLGTALGAKEFVEITAAKKDEFNNFVKRPSSRSVNILLDDEAPPPVGNVMSFPQKTSVSDTKIEKELNVLKGQLEQILNHRSQANGPSAASVSSSLQVSRDDPRMSDPLKRVISALADKRFSEEIISNCRDRVYKTLNAEEQQNPDLVYDTVKKFLSEIIPLAPHLNVDPQATKIIVLVGATGVGKTTTLAKLAAKHIFQENRKVALFTNDDFRIAAFEQLKVYADIFESEFSKVSDATELNEKISGGRYDLVFIDTAGRSQHDIVRLNELKQFLSGISGNVDIYLTIAGNVADENLLDIFLNFEKIGFNAILITKVDETKAIGKILSIVSKMKKPIAFFCDGQRVPDDIHEGEISYITNLLWGRY